MNGNEKFVAKFMNILRTIEQEIKKSMHVLLINVWVGNGKGKGKAKAKYKSKPKPQTQNQPSLEPISATRKKDGKSSILSLW